MSFLKLKARINLKTSLGKLFSEVYFLKYQPGQVLISIFNKLSRRQHLYKPGQGQPKNIKPHHPKEAQLGNI